MFLLKSSSCARLIASSARQFTSSRTTSLSSAARLTRLTSAAGYATASGHPAPAPHQQQGIKKNISALRYKGRNSLAKRRSTPGKDEWSTVGYSVAESLDLIGLSQAIQEQLIYSQMPLADDVDHSCLYATNKYHIDSDVQHKEIFFFKEGCVVFWNVPELERDGVLRFIRAYSEDSYSQDLVFDESEMMNYCISNTGSSHLDKGVIHVQSDCDRLVKYSFSNAIVSSVKLGIWEATLDRIIDSIEHVSEDMKRNKIKMSIADVMQKTGEMLALRHMINLSSDLLDTPDFYWDRERLERLYMETCSHLAVGKRTRVVNEKLSHCLELMELIANQLNADHGARLEWIIIILIAIEICFEVLHVYLELKE